MGEIWLEKEQTNVSLTEKLPQELRESYKKCQKGSLVVEGLKVAAALKLWFDRGYREVGFGLPCDFGGKTFYVDVLARDAEGVWLGWSARCVLIWGGCVGGLRSCGVVCLRIVIWLLFSPLAWTRDTWIG